MRSSLRAPGWNERARAALDRLLRQGARKGLPVVFDFDNTIISGDVGEATLAILAADGRLCPGGVCKKLCPDLSGPGARRLRIEDCPDIMRYYEALLTPTAHGPADPTPLANGYVWATEVLEGLTVAEVLAATARVYQLGQVDPHASIQLAASKSSYPLPRFHEEMVELIGHLLRLKYKVWIV